MPEPMISTAPEWAVILAGKQREKSAAAAGVELDLPINIERFVSHIAAQPTPTVGERNIAIFRETCWARDFGCSEETALALIDKHYNQRFDEPLEDQELSTTVWSAYRSAQNDAGAHALRPTAETFATALAALPPANDREPRDPTSFGSLFERNIGPVRELVPGLIERGIATFLAGVGGTHKSRLAMQLGLCIAAGKPALGREVEQCAFIYVSGEDNEDEVARRAQAIRNRLALPADIPADLWDISQHVAPMLVIGEDAKPVEDKFGKRLRARLTAMAGHKFVVLDSAYNVMRFEGQAKISEAAVQAAIKYLDRLCVETDSTLLCLWHPSQAGQDREDHSGWSVAWHNTPRARLAIKAEKDDRYELACVKRSHGPKGPPIILHFERGALVTRSDIADGEYEARFLEACVRVAIDAAASGQAIQRQRKAPKWVFDALEREMGRRPNDRDLKEALAKAQSEKRLRYLLGNNSRSAGYRPFENDENSE